MIPTSHHCLPPECPGEAERDAVMTDDQLRTNELLSDYAEHVKQGEPNGE